MKVRALKHFHWKDSLREQMVNRKPEEVFEADPDIDREQIYFGLQSGQITIVDESYIPLKGRYVGVHAFTEQKGDGLLKITPGEFVTLRQDDACRLMARGFVRPESETAWRPQRLLTGDIGKAAPKRMFDDLELPSKESWITAPHRLKGGTE